MQTRNFIPEAENKLRKILQDLNLQPVESVKHTMEKRIKDLKRYYYAICLDKDNKKYFFKANIVDEQETNEAFAREIWLNKTVVELKNKNNLNVQLYRKEGIDGKIRWALFYFVDGKPIGSIFDFDKDYSERRDEFIKGILGNLSGIQKNTEVMLKSNNLPILEKRDGNWYEKEFLSYEKKAFEMIGENRYKKLLKIVKDKKNFFDEECKVLAHGDFSLSNQIVEKKSELIHTADWEDVHLDNNASDLAFLWVQAWKYPEWRNKMYNEFVQNIEDKERFEKMFALILIQLSVREIIIWKYNDWFEPIKSYVTTKEALRAHKFDLDMAEKKFI
ncbi:MAG: hypothetical protein WC663_06035 [Patescibacteria group bacterium]|jgi:hypothetical protein